MTCLPVRFVEKRRSGRRLVWYWVPPKKLREAGWKITRLPDERNAAIAAAAQLNREVDEWRAHGQVATRTDTVAAMIRAYRASDRFQRLAGATQKGYERRLDIIERWAGNEPLAEVTPAAVHNLKEALGRKRGHREANYVLQVGSALWQFGRSAGQVTGENPWSRPARFSLRPRTAVWSIEDEARFLEVARPELRLAFALALYTLQRQGDILRLPWSSIEGGWFRLRQGKTGALVAGPIALPLQVALDAAPRRGPLVLTTMTGRVYTSRHLQNQWGEATKAAGLQGLQFRDLRRTGMVRLFQCGVDVETIAALSGHRIERTKEIIEVYIPRGQRLGLAQLDALLGAWKHASGG